MRMTQRMARTVWALVFAMLATTALGAQVSKGPGGPEEGIKVRGQWAIDVKNPDGSLAKHYEFENALVSDGQIRLSNFLGRTRTPGRWAIIVFDGLCTPDSGASTVCLLTEAGSTYGGTPYTEPNNWPNLVLAQATPGAPGLTLRGSFTAAAAGTVSSVATTLGACAQTSTPQNCIEFDPGGAAMFSARALPAPVAVQAGQVVQISVTFSFH